MKKGGKGIKTIPKAKSPEKPEEIDSTKPDQEKVDPPKVEKPEKLEKIGEGSYGLVYRGYLPGISEKIVLKRNMTDITADFTGSVRELDILVKLSMYNHPNIVKFKKLVPHQEVEHLVEKLGEEKSIKYKDDTHHFVFENGICDLCQLLETEKISFQEMVLFIMDILQGLKFIHELGYLHRDIKIENMLVFGANPQGINRRHIKICDFGLAKPKLKYGGNTPRIVTAWYRPPDVCLDNVNYSEDIDMWSLGICIVEMLDDNLFKDCEDSIKDLIPAIFSKLPSDCFGKIPFEIPGDVKTLIKKNGISKEEFYKGLKTQIENPELYDLIVKLTKIDPKERIKSADALKHPLFKDIIGAHLPISKKSKEVKLKIINSKVRRDTIMSTVYLIYNEQEHLPWYKHRTIFQAISFLDRYLAHSAHKEDVHEEIVLKFLICLYLSVKYFTTIEPLLSFEEFIIPDYHTEANVKFASKFELFLLSSVFKFDIYQETPFEVLLNKDSTEEDVRDVLLFYGRTREFDGTLTEYCKKYSKNKKS